MRTLSFLWTLVAWCVLCSFCQVHAQSGLDASKTAVPAGGTPSDGGQIPVSTEFAAEAQEAARRGIDLLKSKDYPKAIEAFQIAVDKHPEVAELQHFLGFAYAQNKQLGEAWLHFRQAVRLNPNYKDAVRDFSSLWQAFESRGVFNCGRSQEDLQKLVGKPDKASTNGAVWEYGFKQIHLRDGKIAAIVDPRGLTPDIAYAKLRLDVQFDERSRWRLGYRTVSRIQSLSEYIPAGQPVTDWSELYTVQRIHGLAKKQTANEMMRKMELNLKKRNPAIEFAVIAESQNDVLFQWRDQGDGQRKPQHELVRLLGGQRDMHRIAYAQRVAQIDNPMAKTWVGVLQRAKLVPSGVTPPAAAGAGSGG